MFDHQLTKLIPLYKSKNAHKNTSKAANQFTAQLKTERKVRHLMMKIPEEQSIYVIGIFMVAATLKVGLHSKVRDINEHMKFNLDRRHPLLFALLRANSLSCKWLAIAVNIRAKPLRRRDALDADRLHSELVLPISRLKDFFFLCTSC